MQQKVSYEIQTEPNVCDISGGYVGMKYRKE